MSAMIRSEMPSDIAAIHALTEAAFLNTPHTSHTEQFIVDALRHAGALAISLVAEEEGTVVGHVAVSPVSISDGSRDYFGLGPISVRPERQGQGIGSFLMQSALRLLREQGAAGCVVLGYPGFYHRFGFKPAAELILPEARRAENFQVVSFGSTLPRGVVTYHEAFKARG